MGRNWGVAVLLNFFFSGLGYLYLGKRKAFGVIVFLGNIAFLFALGYAITFPRAFPLTGQVRTYMDLNSVGFLITKIAFALDAYQLSTGPPPP